MGADEPQAANVRYITESVDRLGYPPSMREIGQAVKLASTSCRQDGQVRLMSHNSAYELSPGDQAQILGKVVRILRQL